MGSLIPYVGLIYQTRKKNKRMATIKIEYFKFTRIRNIIWLFPLILIILSKK